MSGHGAVLCGHGAVDHAVQGHGQVFAGYPIVFKGHHFLAAGKTLTSYAPGDVEEVKQLPNEVFCILTMQKYVPFRGNRRPLCLPADPNHFYKEAESKRVEILGFGYDIQSYNDVKNTAEDEVRWGRFVKYTRSMTKETYGVISRKNCNEQLNSPLLEIM